MSKETKKVKKSKLRKTLEWIFLSIFGVFFVVIFGFQIVGNITKKDNFGVPNVLGTPNHDGSNRFYGTRL